MGKSNKRLTIGIDGTPLFRNMDGIGRYTLNIVRSTALLLPAERFIIVGFAGDKSRLSKDLDLPANVTISYLPLPRRLYQIVFSRLHPFGLDKFSPHTFDYFLHFNFTCFPYYKKVTKRVLFVHDVAYIDIPETIERKNLTYLRKRVPWSIQEAQHVIASSSFTSERIAEVFNVPAATVSNAVGGNFFLSPVTPRAPVPFRNYILTVGTQEPRKNMSTLIEAHLSLPLKVRKAHPLLIVGSKGWGKDTVRKSSDPYIHWLGYVDDDNLPSLYQHAKLFVFPSRYEGFGLPLLEAMASGTPIVASDIPPFRDIAGDTVTLVDSSQASYLTKAMFDSLSNPLNKRFITQAKKRAANFTWKKSAQRLVATLGLNQR